MNIEQIELSLMKLFNKDMDIYQKRHIVFWYDPSWEFAEDFDNLNLGWIKKHKLDDNFFYTKYLLEIEDIENSYLLYSQTERPNSDNNWLLDIFIYSQEFSADKSSVILNEVWITDISIKPIIEEHIKFFSSKKRTDDFIKLNLDKNSIKSIKLSMLATLVWEKTTNFDDILRKIFVWWFEDNKFLDDFEKFNLLDTFWEFIKLIYCYDKEVSDLRDLFINFIISNIKFSWDYELPLHLESQSKCSNSTNIFINNFMNHKSDYEIYRKISEETSNDLWIFDKVIKNLNEIKDIETVSSVDKTILISIAWSLSNKNTDFKHYIDIINTRKSKHWYDVFESQYEVLFNAIKIYEFKEKYSSWFNQITARELFEDYTKDLYVMDTYYRLFNYNFDKAQISLKNNYLSWLQKEIEWIYTNWFLDELTNKQISLLKAEWLDNWNIPWINRQQDFYEKEVGNALTWKNTKRVFVVISDALRYECWHDLYELLEKERWTVNLTSMQWVIPSYTKLWMASLLPHNDIEIDKSWRIIVDWIDTTSTDWRNKVLNKHVESIAIKWSELIKYSQSEARELIVDKKVVYIYHNVIDAIWDDAKTEYKTFEACNDWIIELKDIVKYITNNQIWNNVIITADHWFIYKKEPLVESDKISLEKITRIDNNRRFILSDDEKNIDWTLKIDMWYLWNKWISAVLPNWNSRFKIQWGWSNFVHGSLSLQEIAIPIINFKYQKDLKVWSTDFKKEVEITLSNTNRTISNNMFTLVFHQKEAMTWKLLQWMYRISLWDTTKWKDSVIVSDEKSIIADKESDKIEDRMFRVSLTLRSGVKNWTYRLRIFSDWKSKTEKPWYDFDVNKLIDNDFDAIF